MRSHALLARSRILAALMLVAACPKSPEPPPDTTPEPIAWEDQVIYFVMTDRFSNGDPLNDDQGAGEFDPADPARYSGGDLQGVIDRLDYIQSLGATAVWITPPVANMWWDPIEQSGGYHGYWARNLKKVDEHLGTIETYRALSAALHERGMLLIQDVVPNHMGNFFKYSSYDPSDPTAGFVKNTGAVPTSKPETAPFDQNDVTDPAQRAAGIYHWTPAISDYSDPYQELNYQISDLDDLNSENPVVRQALRDAYGFWIREVGVDAFRVDTAKFAPHDFWHDFFHSTDEAAPGMHGVAQAAGRDAFFAFGEVFETSQHLDDKADKKVASFLGTAQAPELPSLLQFPLYEEIGRVFAAGKPTSYLRYRLERFMDPALYPNPHRMPTFVDNHDVRRFLAVGTGEGLVQALALIFTLPGIPTVYYGTEQAFTETRASMFASGFGSGGVDHFNPASGMFGRIKTLASIRKAHPVFTRGDLTVLSDNEAGAGAFAYRRTFDGQTALVIFNTAEEIVLASGLATGLAPGTVLETLHSELGAPLPKVDANGEIQLVLPKRSFLIARSTGTVETPQPPAVSITVDTPIEGQTFTKDVTVTGTVTPANAPVRMVVDGYIGKGANATVAQDGTWSVILPVSTFPEERAPHTVAFYAGTADTATRPMKFISDVVFVGNVVEDDDPLDDDRGPNGTYTYPLDASFGNQMDIVHWRAEYGVTTMNLKITMADWSTVWSPPYGFDHVAFNVYFALPGRAGTRVMPKLNASTPEGFEWSYNQFSYGWDNVMYTSAGATATSYGAPATAPTVKANGTSKMVIFTYDRNAFGLSTWSGTRIYVATWDFDGIGARFRPLSPTGGPWEMGGGQETDPMIMDDITPIAIP